MTGPGLTTPGKTGLSRHPVRGHALWYAHIIHRVSGIALALFLPLHFWVLSLALNDAARLDSFLAFTELPLVKLAEFGLVFLLAIHLFGGMRLMALEWLPWRAPHKTLAAGALAVSAFISGVFFLQAI
jgi:fumarate reductase subunit D